MDKLTQLSKRQSSVPAAQRHPSHPLVRSVTGFVRQLAHRLLYHVFRKASWIRAVRLLRHGQWQVLSKRLIYELRSALHETKGSGITHATVDPRLLDPESLEPVPFALATASCPELSIVIPVHGQQDLTWACLRSIADSPPSVPFEVVIMDDGFLESTHSPLPMVSGARIIRNTMDRGSIGNINAGANAARGRWLIMLSSDTVICRGALDRLLVTFAEHEHVGLVGAKLLDRYGSLQEAGGVVWRDGSASRCGRGAERKDPRFNYVRDVDYCSGAVLAVERDLFLDLGGLDTGHCPDGYEDIDLAFRIRARGLRVLFQPAAEVYCLQGMGNGRGMGAATGAGYETDSRTFRERWQAVLNSHDTPGPGADREGCRKGKGSILIVEARMIAPDQDSGSARLFNLQKLLKAEGYHVTFMADNIEYPDKYGCLLEAQGIEVLHGNWAGSVRRVLRRLGPSLHAVILCRHHIASRYVALARACAPDARIILDMADLHFVREEREAHLTGNAVLRREAAATQRRELALVTTADVAIVVSEFEKDLLAKLAPGAHVEIISDIQLPVAGRPGYAGREGILFIGSFLHPPNVDAVHWYAREIVPHLRTLIPGVVTSVIGSNMPDEIKALESDQLAMRGFVENIAPELANVRVSIAPLRFGAGVKGKVNKAMIHGVPVVATSCAVEGMRLTAGKDVLVADEPRAFAEAIARVYRDEQLWLQMSTAGIRNVESHFSPDAALPALRRILA